MQSAAPVWRPRVAGAVQRQPQLGQRLGEKAAAGEAPAQLAVLVKARFVPLGIVVQHREGERVHVPIRRIDKAVRAEVLHISQHGEVFRPLFHKVADEEQQVAAGYVVYLLQQRPQQRQVAVYVADGDETPAGGQGEGAEWIFHRAACPFVRDLSPRGAAAASSAAGARSVVQIFDDFAVFVAQLFARCPFLSGKNRLRPRADR